MCLRGPVHDASSLVHHEMLPSWSVKPPPPLTLTCQRSAGRRQPIRANSRADKASHSGENGAAEVGFKVTIGWLLAHLWLSQDAQGEITSVALQGLGVT